MSSGYVDRASTGSGTDGEDELITVPLPLEKSVSRGGKTSWPRISPPDGQLSPAPELLTGCMEPGIQTERGKVGGD